MIDAEASIREAQWHQQMTVVAMLVKHSELFLYRLAWDTPSGRALGFVSRSAQFHNYLFAVVA